MGDHSLVLSVETGERVPLRVFIVGCGRARLGLGLWRWALCSACRGPESARQRAMRCRWCVAGVQLVVGGETVRAEAAHSQSVSKRWVKGTDAAAARRLSAAAAVAAAAEAAEAADTATTKKTGNGTRRRSLSRRGSSGSKQQQQQQQQQHDDQIKGTGRQVCRVSKMSVCPFRRLHTLLGHACLLACSSLAALSGLVGRGPYREPRTPAGLAPGSAPDEL